MQRFLLGSLPVKLPGGAFSSAHRAYQSDTKNKCRACNSNFDCSQRALAKKWVMTETEEALGRWAYTVPIIAAASQSGRGCSVNFESNENSCSHNKKAPYQRYHLVRFAQLYP